MRRIIDSFVFGFTLRSVCDRFIEQPSRGDIQKRDGQGSLANWLRGLARNVSIF